MKVTLVRSAGLIPVLTETVADSATLTPDHASTLEGKVRESRILEGTETARPAGEAPMPDAAAYRLTVDDGQRQRTLVLDERSITPAVRGLIDWVSAVPGRTDTVRPIGRS